MIRSLVVIVVAVFLFFVFRRFNYWRRKGVSQHVVWSPFGAISPNVLQKRSMADILAELYDKFYDQPFFGIYTFFTPVLVLRDLQLIKDIAIRNANNFSIHKIFSNGDMEQSYTNNLFSTQSGSKWKRSRSSLTPAFTISKMRSVYVLITKCAEQWRDSIHLKPGEVHEADMKLDVFNRFTNDVIANFVFGIDSNSFVDKDSEFYRRSLETSDFSGLKIFATFGHCFSRFLVKLFDFRLITTENENFFSKLVLRVMDIRRKTSLVRPDMVNYFMQIQNSTLETENVTDMEIVGHSLLMISAGSDTPSSALNFLAYELAVNPDIQTKLHLEIKATLDASSGELSHESLSTMTYLDMVISEGLRKWPPLPLTDRANEFPHDIEFDGKIVHLEKGSILWIPIMCIHRDPEYYPDPERFDPERFSGGIMKDCYLPFGMGPRSCIGARLAVLMMKSIIVHILRDFELVPVEKTTNRLELSKSNIFLHPQTPMVLGLKRRDHN